MTIVSRIAALILFVGIAFATLSPIEMRPQTGEPNFERAAAYFLFGIAIAMGFPSRLVQSAVVVAIAAAGLEALQLIDPGRHGRLEDLFVKVLGGLVGLALVHAARASLRHLRA